MKTSQGNLSSGQVMGDVVFQELPEDVVIVDVTRHRNDVAERCRQPSPASSVSSVTQMASNDDDDDDKTTYFPSPKTSFTAMPKRLRSLY